MHTETPPHRLVIAPSALLFDLDGTLADTEPAWIHAKATVAKRHRIPWTEEDNLRSVGQPTPVYSAEFVARGAAATATAIANEITSEVVARLGAGISWRPGAQALVTRAHALGIPTALVTMAYRPVALAISNAMGSRPFTIVVAGDDVRRQKPDPEPYTKALFQLGATKTTAIAVEDTETGATSAQRAGLATIVVPSHAMVQPTRSRWVIRSLLDIDLRSPRETHC